MPPRGARTKDTGLLGTPTSSKGLSWMTSKQEPPWASIPSPLAQGSPARKAGPQRSRAATSARPHLEARLPPASLCDGRHPQDSPGCPHLLGHRNLLPREMLPLPAPGPTLGSQAQRAKCSVPQGPSCQQLLWNSPTLSPRLLPPGVWPTASPPDRNLDPSPPSKPRVILLWARFSDTEGLHSACSSHAPGCHMAAAACAAWTEPPSAGSTGPAAVRGAVAGADCAEPSSDSSPQLVFPGERRPASPTAKCFMRSQRPNRLSSE